MFCQALNDSSQVQTINKLSINIVYSKVLALSVTSNIMRLNICNFYFLCHCIIGNKSSSLKHNSNSSFSSLYV